MTICSASHLYLDHPHLSPFFASRLIDAISTTFTFSQGATAIYLVLSAPTSCPPLRAASRLLVLSLPPSNCSFETICVLSNSSKYAAIDINCLASSAAPTYSLQLTPRSLTSRRHHQPTFQHSLEYRYRDRRVTRQRYKRDKEVA